MQQLKEKKGVRYLFLRAPPGGYIQNFELNKNYSGIGIVGFL